MDERTFTRPGHSAADAVTVAVGGGGAPPEVSVSLLLPDQQFGPYRIVRLLGRGGMGEVYEAEESASGRRVALKLFNRALGDPVERERFLREGQLAASVSHPRCVYVLGTLEIQGVPTLAMELVSGGTLKDLVQARGVLAPREAVDIILQVVDGLEAAASAGILHRDVKPANCFVERDGSVKVGDFGVSTSLHAREETLLTLSGSVLGTPGYAAPEQLRGEPVDMRADIYAVGATLYNLLTGRPPFEGTNLVTMVAKVLQETPPSPSALQASVPRGLSAVVMRSLAKKPSERPQTYADLRRQLLPFCSLAPTPATIGLRVVAGLVDVLLCSLLATPFSGRALRLLFVAQTNAAAVSVFQVWMVMLTSYVLTLVYFTTLEGLLGRSPGKALLGLRVVDAHRQAPGLLRAGVRALCYASVLNAGTILLCLVVGPVAVFTVGSSTDAPLWLKVASTASTLTVFVLFASARRRNGFAGLHELATGTRVVSREAARARQAARQAPAVAPPPTGERMGPYGVLAREVTPDGGALVTAFDERLRRTVWIRPAAPDAPPLPASRRAAARPGRARWLNGRREGADAWDAFEAWTGRPLVDLAAGTVEWAEVRGWLADLNSEIDGAASAGEIASIALDRVWIGDDGRAKLLDWPAPGSDPSPAPAVVIGSSFDDAQRFLRHVAARLLDGAHGSPLPLHATEILDRLGRADFKSSTELAEALRAAEKRPDRVSRGRRALSLALCGVIPCFILMTTAIVGLMARNLIAQRPEVALLDVCLARLDVLQYERGAAALEERRALEVFIAGRFAQAVKDPAVQTPSGMMLLSTQRLARADRLVSSKPHVSAEELGRARVTLRDFLERAERTAAERASGRIPWEIVLFVIAMVFALCGIPGVLSSVVCRGGLLFTVLGIGLATASDRRASRVRAGLRALAAWAPVLAGAGLVFLRRLGTRHGIPAPVFGVAAAVLLLVFLAGLVVAILYPGRGLQDRIAGTWLVPR